MAIDVERLLVSLEANLKQYERELARAQRVTVSQLRRIERDAQASATRVENAFARLGAGFKAGLIGAIGGVSLDNFLRQVNSAVKAAADLGDAAAKVGVTAEQLQRLGFAAKQSGSDAESMQRALQEFSKRVGEAARGTGDLLKVLEANGIALRDAQGNIRPINDLFLEYANLVQGAATQTDRQQLAFIGMGKAGAEVVLVLEQGANGLKALGDEAVRTGNVMSEELVQRAREIDDEFNALVDGAITRFQSGVIASVVAVRDLVSWIDNLSVSLTRLSGVDIDVGSSISQALRTNPATNGLMQIYDFFNGPPGGSAIGGGGQASNVAAKGNKLGSTVIPPATSSPLKQVADDAREAGTALKEPVKLLGEFNQKLQKGPDYAAAFSNAFSGFAADLAKGATFTDALTRALTRLQTKLIDMVLSGAFETLFADGFGGLFGGGGGGSAGIGDAIVASGIYHDGGRVGSGGRKRGVSASAFMGAPRFHNGGEVPAILKPGEWVLTPEQMRAMGSGSKAPVNVRVVNNGGADVRAERSREPGFDLDIFIERKVNDVISSGRGDRSLAGRFALRPQTGRR